MHILLLAPAIVDYSIEYANAVARNNARVTLVAPSRLFRETVQYVDDTVDLRLLDWPRHRSLRNAIFLFRFISLVERLQPDVIHFLSEGISWLSFVVPFLSRRYPIVTTMHDVEYHPGDHASRRVPRCFANHLIARSDKVLVHGARLRRDAKQRYPKLATKFEVMPHVLFLRYFDIARRNKMSRKHDRTINVLFFGRIYAYKGLDVLIRCVPLVVKSFSNIRITIAGTGEDIDKYISMMHDLSYYDIRNRHIPDEEVAELFTEADIIVFPYVEASQSGVLAIAYSFGKPVIVTDVGELASTIEDGKTGLIVPARDEGALAEAILRLARNPALRTELGNSGRIAAHGSASPKLVADIATKIYEELLVHKNRAGSSFAAKTSWWKPLKNGIMTNFFR
jgi:glycosyltransferase involved in cell wall biosynthesis